MLQTKVFENYRDYSSDEIKFATDVVCNFCKIKSPQYLQITDGVMYDPKVLNICKGCLEEWIKTLDKTYIEYCKNETRD